VTGRILPFRRAGRPQPPAAGGAAGVVRLGPANATGRAGATPSPADLAARFDELVLPHLDGAYSLARYLARNAEAAEDIAQEALLKAFRRMETLRAEDAKPWLMAIVRNAYFDWRRQTQGDPITGDAAEAVLAETPDEAQLTAEDALIRSGDAAALRAAIETIPEPFREALVLRDLEELSYRQVSEITGAPMGTVMSRLARARRMLGERLGLMEAPA